MQFDQLFRAYPMNFFALPLSRWMFVIGAACTTAVSLPAQAAGVLENPLSDSSVQATRDAVRSMIGKAQALPAVPAAAGQALPELAIGSNDNVAGVLEYCVNNNVLARASVDPVKETLLAHGVRDLPQNGNDGYRHGVAGLLTGSDGRSLDLRKAQPQLKEQACDYVLGSTKSLI
jgi:hypothetical protein